MLKKYNKIKYLAWKYFADDFFDQHFASTSFLD